jgi:hypothetical protein
VSSAAAAAAAAPPPRRARGGAPFFRERPALVIVDSFGMRRARELMNHVLHADVKEAARGMKDYCFPYLLSWLSSALLT